MAETYNLPAVKINSKNPPKIPSDVIIQNEKRDGHFQQILALYVRKKNTFCGKSNYFNLRKSGYSVNWDRNFSNRTKIFTTHSLSGNRI